MKTLGGDMPQFPRFAKTKEEATHRYPTSIRWGEGEFDGMRHLVCDSDLAAYSVMRRHRSDCDWENLWRRDAEGQWVNCKDLKS